MIPKIIHYCWFGYGPKSPLALKCIESWKSHLPDYQIIEWNEDRFDVNQNQYAKEAYENHKYAFVADYVRLYSLYAYGGIYMDTDVEVIGSFDPFLHHHAFLGFETDGNVQTGMMAAEKGSVWAKALLDQYERRHFILPEGGYDLTTNAVVITQYMIEQGLIRNNSFQEFPKLCTLYPTEYFCPKDHRTGLIHCTESTVCIHHFEGSWTNHSWFETFRHSLKVSLAKLFGGHIISVLSDIITLRIFRKRNV